MDKKDFEFFQSLYRIAKGLAILIHKFASWFTGWIVKLLGKASAKIGSKDEAQRAKFFMIFQIVQLAVVLVAFIISSDRFRLFCNVLYSTPPGFVAGAIQTFNANHDISMRELFLGDSVTWLTVGVQTILLGWYAEVLKKYESRWWFRGLSMILFTYASGVLLTFGVSFCYGHLSVVESLANIKVLYYIVMTVLWVLLALLFIIALDCAITNIKLVFVTCFSALILMQIFNWLLELIPILNATVPASIHDQVQEIILLVFTIGGYFLGIRLQGVWQVLKEKFTALTSDKETP